MVLLIDAFIFYNETQMLDFRFAELYEVVDYFVLVEASKTFAGNDKHLYFNENKDRYKKYIDKVVHVMVDDMPITGCDAWAREKHQRKCIDRGISQLKLADNDIIIISDCDEIPDPQTLRGIKKDGLTQQCSLNMDMYYYNLTCKGLYWYFPKILPFSVYKSYGRDPQRIRWKSGKKIQRGGWHFSYFGGIEFIKNKIRNFSHQEFNDEKYLDNTKIQEQINGCADLFFRTGRQSHGLHKVPICDNDYLPRNYKMLLTTPSV